MSRAKLIARKAPVIHSSPDVAELGLMDEELRWYQLQDLDREDLPEHLPCTD